jgi:serine/threonine protein kinase/formylglycine-generating enzyme required for sulfatase activity
MEDLPLSSPTPTQPPSASPSSPPGGERVHSTATGELLQRLATAPKLDTHRFQLEGELGKGGMGVVLRVHDQFLNRRLAMKVLLERGTPRDDEEERLLHQLLGRFLEEAQVTSQLDHPGVVPVHELGLDQHGKVYFTMRMVKGRTAHDVFADAHNRRGEWDLTRALEVILKVCDTMAYAHDKGVLHRDLKPSNVMVGRFGEVYVMDWGLAKVLGHQDRHDLRIQDAGTGFSRLETARKRDTDTDTENSLVSMDGQQLGTPSYMSPEQARSEELDARADVYSLGAMLYELVTGSTPYAQRGLRKPAYRILEDVVDGPPKRVEELARDVPAELVAVIDKAMARDRGQRYRSVQDLAADVRAFLAERVVSAYRTGAWQETKLWVRRNQPLAVSLAAAVLLLVGGIVSVTVFASEANAHAQLARKNEYLANAAKQEADGKAKALAAKVADFDRLALVVDYDRLLQEEPGFYPGYPEQADAIANWLLRAQRLLGRKDELAAFVAAVQPSARSEGSAASGRVETPAAAQGGPSQAAEQFLARSLGELLGRLSKFTELVALVQQRQRWAQVIGPLTSANPNAKVTWAEARAAVAASPNYRGQDIPLRDRDVLGLVPIGENPQSGLWEFYDLRSAWDGKVDPATLRIPSQMGNGHIVMTARAGVVFVLLPGGTLPSETPVRDSVEERRLGVRLDAFFIGKYEVSQAQWERWTGENPSLSTGANRGVLPVEGVTWYAADQTLTRLGLRLPSELQWEYGVRGGTPTLWWTGDRTEDIERAEWCSIGPPQPIGRMVPNPFGLCDMAGNVGEWCFDLMGAVDEREGDGRTSSGESRSGLRAVRGGSGGTSLRMQSGRRVYTDPADATQRTGVRAVRALRH